MVSTSRTGPVPTDGLELDPRFTFDTLVVGTANRLAAAAARRVAENPGRVYNPLFIYSGSGLGKTHLLTAMGHYAQRLNPGLQVVYGTLEHFLQRLMSAIEGGERDAFLQRVRGTGLLLLDDVQFLAGQRGVQEELIRAWDTVFARGGQVVLASDRTPAEIDQLGERLISRFSGGLVLDIGSPDFETRVAIARQKAAERGRLLATGVPEALARFTFASVRELQGALNRILAVQELEDRVIRADEVPAVLGVVKVGSAAADVGGVGAPAGFIEPELLRSSLIQAIRKWSSAGYRTQRLEWALQLGDLPSDVTQIMAQFAADAERLAEILAQIRELEASAPELQRTEVLRDPDRLDDAERLLDGVRERMQPLPAPPPDVSFATTGLAGELLAVRATRAAGERRSGEYSPLFIHGPAGSGKSRLLASLGNELIAGGRSGPVAYVKGSTFAAELVEALQRDRVPSWRARYHRARTLLVDDVDALAETELAQQELFHLFDALERAGGLLAFTASRPPQALAGIEDRLRTRLASGLVVDLPAPAAPAVARPSGAEASGRVTPRPTAEAELEVMTPAADAVRDTWFLNAQNVVLELNDPLDFIVQELD